MAKTIKFNLICDNYPVRTMEDLREHFSLEDILKYYKSGLLCRWLDVRGYQAELEKVNGIKDKADYAAVRELIRIFGVETDENTIKRDTYIFEYHEKMQAQTEKYEKQRAKKDAVIREYHEGYRNAVRRIIENWEDIAIIKAALKEIDENYRDLFDLDYRLLFEIFYNHAPMALFVMLTIDNMRGKLLVAQTEEFILEETDCARQMAIKELIQTLDKGIGKELGQAERDNAEKDIDYIERERKYLYTRLCKIVDDDAQLEKVFRDNLRQCRLKTAPYEKALEDKGKYMVLRIGRGDKVHPFGAIDQEYDATAINGNFIILDGLVYMSDSEMTSVYYMEV